MSVWTVLGGALVKGAVSLIEESNKYSEEYEPLSDLELQVEHSKLKRESGNHLRKVALEGLLIGRGYEAVYCMGSILLWQKKGQENTSPIGKL